MLALMQCKHGLMCIQECVAYLCQSQVMWSATLPVKDAKQQRRLCIVDIYRKGHFIALNGRLQIPLFLQTSILHHWSLWTEPFHSTGDTASKKHVLKLQIRDEVTTMW